MESQNFRGIMKHSTHLHFSLVVTTLLIFNAEVSRVCAQKLIDPKATKQTQSLHINLSKLAEKGILFGHQDGDAYGVGWKAEAGRSDVKDIVGDYPAIHGWDLGKIGQPENLDGVSFKLMREGIINNYKRGGINTISWHIENPITNKGAWDTARAVNSILPGGTHHIAYIKQLDVVAGFLSLCSVDDVMIPIIFRPFHEHNGNWFWWGKGLCTEQEYIQLWQFTVDYLKNTKKLHHLIYAFSPDRSRIDLAQARQSYLYAYPGDDYVDVFGLDNYMDVGAGWNKKSTTEQQHDLIKVLRTVSQLAKEKRKLAALTETGLEGITNPTWYTDVILNPLKANKDIQLSYVMVWRNANEKHHYAPYPGHAAEEDFKKFFLDPYTFFESDLKNIYTPKKK